MRNSTSLSHPWHQIVFAIAVEINNCYIRDDAFVLKEGNVGKVIIVHNQGLATGSHRSHRSRDNQNPAAHRAVHLLHCTVFSKSRLSVLSFALLVSVGRSSRLMTTAGRSQGVASPMTELGFACAAMAGVEDSPSLK
jgi:hypothetical protein